MIIKLEEILNLNRCEPWTDDRTINFMKSKNSNGEKTIEEFIDDVNIEGITYFEIFWCLTQLLSKRDLRKLIYNIIDNSKDKFNNKYVKYILKITDLYFNGEATDNLFNESKKFLKEEERNLWDKDNDNPTDISKYLNISILLLLPDELLTFEIALKVARMLNLLDSKYDYNFFCNQIKKI